MKEFIFDKKESYSQEDVERLLQEKDAHTKKRVATEKEAEFTLKLETEKQTWEKTWEEKINSQKANENFLSSVPNKNRKVVETLLSKGETQESIKENFTNLFEETKTHVDLDEIINGKLESMKAVANEDTDEKFMNKANEGTLEMTNENIKRYQSIKNKKIA